MTLDQLIEFRRDLHRNPELSEKEFKTQQRIIEALKLVGVDNLMEIGNTGVLVSFNGARRGRSVLLRSDHDALPIQELGEPAHKSAVSGVSHMCGHDGHTAIMLGVAAYFVNNPLNEGQLYLLFQPAEENGRGAQAVLEDKNFSIKPDMVFALHNLPGTKLHQVVCKKGTFTPAVKSVIIRLFGKTSHAAEPEKGINPGVAMGKIFDLAESLNILDKDRADFRVVSAVHAKMGELAYGITAGEAELHFTIRTWTNREMEKLQSLLTEGAVRIASDYQLLIEWEWLEEFFANENSAEAYDIIERTALQAQVDFIELQSGMKWGEDFGLISSKFTGAMFCIGSGEDCPALHNPDYDFPDEIIETGIKMFTGLALNALSAVE